MPSTPDPVESTSGDHPRTERLMEVLRGRAEFVGAPHIGTRQVGERWLIGWTAHHPGEEGVPQDEVIYLAEAGSRRLRFFPAWPLDRIIELLAASRPTDRLHPVVQARLHDAGWYPGRQIPDTDIDAWAATLSPVTGTGINPPARAALREFGGLQLTIATDAHLRFGPTDVPPRHRLSLLGLVNYGPGPLSLLGIEHNGREDSYLVMYSNGQTVMHEAGETYDLGIGIDAALNTTFAPSDFIPNFIH